MGEGIEWRDYARVRRPKENRPTQGWMEKGLRVAGWWRAVVAATAGKALEEPTAELRAVGVMTEGGEVVAGGKDEWEVRWAAATRVQVATAAENAEAAPLAGNPVEGTVAGRLEVSKVAEESLGEERMAEVGGAVEVLEVAEAATPAQRKGAAL